MRVSKKDYTGLNNECPKIKRVLAAIGEQSMPIEEVFAMTGLDYSTAAIMTRYIKEERHEEYQKWSFKHFSFDRAWEEHVSKIAKLEQKEKALQRAIINKERISDTLTPARVYAYFKQQENFTSDAKYRDSMYAVLDLVLSTRKFGQGDYVELRAELSSSLSRPHLDGEAHYRAAVVSNNRTAWREIEAYLGRKPYIISEKRIYEWFEFETEDGYFRCTQFQEGCVRLVKSADRTFYNGRKLLKFNHKEFKEYFKNKKIL